MFSCCLSSCSSHSTFVALIQRPKQKIVDAELSYVIGTLEYIVARITSKEIMSLSLRRRNGLSDEQGVISTGCFLNLHCGHNNQYSSEECEKLIALIHRSCGDSVLEYIFNETYKESCFIRSNLFTKRTIAPPHDRSATIFHFKHTKLLTSMADAQM